MSTQEVHHHKPVKEARWPADLTVLVTILLYVTLPPKITLGPVWIVPALEIALLVALTVAVPMRHGHELQWQRNFSVGLIGVISAINMVSLCFLIYELLYRTERTGAELIAAAMQIWLTNVLIFGLWFWELDRGGPGKRLSLKKQHPDFLFPQMTVEGIGPANWTPRLVDYLYLAFTNATAFSPTDTLPLTTLAKFLMLVEALISLLTIALVAARAVNSLM